MMSKDLLTNGAYYPYKKGDGFDCGLRKSQEDGAVQNTLATVEYIRKLQPDS